MIKLRIEFTKDTELEKIKEHLEQKYEIIDRSEIRKSKQPYNKMRFVYMELEENVPVTGTK